MTGLKSDLESTRVLREVSRIIEGVPTTDGAGVELTRVIGSPELNRLDPFLLLDRFRSDQPQDYIAGFPPHPHRGFETVTYLLAGRMRHQDNAGHEGVIESGGVQWMTAGRGIVHSEMPEQEDGLLSGFQLWVNLPAKHKMDAPAYQEHAASGIPTESRDDGVMVRVIAGETHTGTRGPIQQPLTDPVYFDITLPAHAGFKELISPDHNAFVYLVDGSAQLPRIDGTKASLKSDQLAVLTHGEQFEITAEDLGARLLLVAGKPLNEPVARGGPFVMNTKAEIQQAFDDYSAGRI